eukprot:NODE_5238_length_600_cov_216.726606.p3 GENE.NODE_5238_length_600_cov_216.726606~~NODE_5238_length_600_cov_216.726606.p3  ORF type:complete len:61 (+),score=1.82 NODE_5238_length_600_cov_216.726606:217-399(+)
MPLGDCGRRPASRSGGGHPANESGSARAANGSGGCVASWSGDSQPLSLLARRQALQNQLD